MKVRNNADRELGAIQIILDTFLAYFRPPCVIWWHWPPPLECHVLFEWPKHLLFPTYVDVRVALCPILSYVLIQTLKLIPIPTFVTLRYYYYYLLYEIIKVMKECYNWLQSTFYIWCSCLVRKTLKMTDCFKRDGANKMEIFHSFIHTSRYYV